MFPVEATKIVQVDSLNYSSSACSTAYRHFPLSRSVNFEELDRRIRAGQECTIGLSFFGREQAHAWVTAIAPSADEIELCQASIKAHSRLDSC